MNDNDLWVQAYGQSNSATTSDDNLVDDEYINFSNKSEIDSNEKGGDILLQKNSVQEINQDVYNSDAQIDVLGKSRTVSDNDKDYLTANQQTVLDEVEALMQESANSIKASDTNKMDTLSYSNWSENTIQEQDNFNNALYSLNFFEQAYFLYKKIEDLSRNIKAYTNIKSFSEREQDFFYTNLDFVSNQSKVVCSFLKDKGFYSLEKHVLNKNFNKYFPEGILVALSIVQSSFDEMISTSNTDEIKKYHEIFSRLQQKISSAKTPLLDDMNDSVARLEHTLENSLPKHVTLQAKEALLLAMKKLSIYMDLFAKNI